MNRLNREIEKNTNILKKGVKDIFACIVKNSMFNEGEIDFEFIEWVFNTKSKDFSTLSEKTSLQKNLKQHLLSGGIIRNSYGRMNLQR